ncbi:MAG: hypothetical protein PSY14_17375 [bacterium]|nr:hypothetical protein [bacterium]
MAKNRFGKNLVIGFAIVTCVLIVGANAHFVYLASTTQPDCVAHKKPGSDIDRGYAAAKSSC